jgi:hypothetical protein
VGVTHDAEDTRVIKDVKQWSAWEAEGPLREPPDFQRNLRLLEGMYELARSLRVFPPAEPLAGLETDIYIARVINVRGAAGTDRSGA